MHMHMRLLCLCTERLSCFHWLSHCGWLLSSEIFIYLDSPVLTFPSFSIQPAALTIDEGTVACLPKSYWRQPPNPEALVLILEHLPHCQDRSRTQGAHVVCALWIIMIWPWKSGWTLKIVWCLHSKTAYCVCLFTVTLTMRLTDLLSQAQLPATPSQVCRTKHRVSLKAILKAWPWVTLSWITPPNQLFGLIFWRTKYSVSFHDL